MTDTPSPTEHLAAVTGIPSSTSSSPGDESSRRPIRNRVLEALCAQDVDRFIRELGSEAMRMREGGRTSAIEDGARAMQYSQRRRQAAG